MQHNSILTLASASLLALSLGGAAQAQQDPGGMEQQQPDTAQQQPGMGEQQPGMGQQAQQDVDLSNMYKASSLQDLEIRDSQGQSLGSISEVIIDDQGQVAYVAMSEGGFLGVGGTSYLIPWDRIEVDPQQNAATVDVQQDQLSAEFAAFDELPPTSLDQGEQQQQDGGQQQQSGGGQTGGGY